jgi:plasmid stabilization system protein ParE
MKTYKLDITIAAQEDLERLYDFLSDQDAFFAERAVEAIEKAYEFLRFMPESCRRAPTRLDGHVYREMIVKFGRSGYLILFEIQGDETVSVIAVKHQRESDYH